MKIAVIGAGYVGLTTAACFAETGHEVLCAEIQPEKLAALNSGKLPLYEPYLAELIAKNREAGRLRFGSTEEAAAASEVIFICVGTPLMAGGEVDLSAVEAAARTIAGAAHGYRLIIQKSTVPVGSCDQLSSLLVRHRPAKNGHDPFTWDVVSNPEFLREGSAMHDFLHPSRVVIGSENPRAAEALREIYRPILEGDFECPIHAARHRGDIRLNKPAVIICGPRTAEMIKHTANSFLAMKISFINMVADLCESVGGDVEKVAEGTGLDGRIGSAFLNPGIGFGGSCFPKDVQGFIHVAEKAGCDFSLLKEVERINAERVDRFVARVREQIGPLAGKRIGVWGLAFKPNTDDIRNSPAVAIVRHLLAEGAEVRAYDPAAMDNVRREALNLGFCANPYEAAEDADALLALTAWDEFVHADFSRVRRLMRRPLIFDGRNMLPPQELARQGLIHVRIGYAEAAATPDQPIPAEARLGVQA